eukprot:3767262-Rhodomonas_salina.1
MAQVSSNIQSPFPNTSRLSTAELHTAGQCNRQLEPPGSSPSTHTHTEDMQNVHYRKVNLGWRSPIVANADVMPFDSKSWHP